MRSCIDQLPNKLSSGFSLTELLVSCGLMASIASFAVPSFGDLIERKSMDTAVMKVERTLSLARSSALSHGKTVLVCQLESLEPLNCTDSHKRNTPWDLGWLVFVDNDGNNVLSEEDTLLQQFAASQTTPMIFNQNGKLRFFADGSSRSAGFYLCSKNSPSLKHVKLLYSGRFKTVNNRENDKINMCKSMLNPA